MWGPVSDGRDHEVAAVNKDWFVHGGIGCGRLQYLAGRYKVSRELGVVHARESSKLSESNAYVEYSSWMN